MANQLALIEEAYSRGLQSRLPAESRALYEEAVKRGLVEGKSEPQQKVTPKVLGFDVPESIGNAVVGMGSGFLRAGEGLGQLGQFIGEKHPVPAIRKLMGAIPSQTDEQVQSRRAQFADTSASQSIAGKAGEIVGEAAPYMALPFGGATLPAKLGLGAGGGAATGAGQFVEEGGSRLANTALGAGLGAALPAGAAGLRVPLSEGVKKMFRGGTTKGQVGSNIAAFETAGVTPTIGQATENKAAQAFTNLVAKAPGGISKARRFAETQQEEVGKTVQRAIDNLAKDSGIGPESAGRVIEKGISGTGGFMERFQTKAGELYNRVDELVPADMPVPVTGTSKVMAELSGGIPGAPALSKELQNSKVGRMVEAFTSDLSEQGTLPYQAARSLRSGLGRELNSSELISGAPRAQVKRIYGALTDDLRDSVEALGPEAAGASKAANEFYKSQSRLIDDYIDRIVAKKVNPEDVFRAATAGSREGGSTLRAVRRTLKKDEWEAVVGSVLHKLGRATKGQQDETGEMFSTNTFLSNWTDLSPEAKNELFAGSRKLAGYRQDMEQIAKTSALIREGAKVLSNPSGTGPVVGQIAYALTGLSPIAYGAVNPLSGAALVGGLMAGANRSVWLMTKPEVVKWTARAMKMPPSKIPQQLARLETVVQTSDPERQQELEQYKESVLSILQAQKN